MVVEEVQHKVRSLPLEKLRPMTHSSNLMSLAVEGEDHLEALAVV